MNVDKGRGLELGRGRDVPNNLSPAIRETAARYGLDIYSCVECGSRATILSSDEYAVVLAKTRGPYRLINVLDSKGSESRYDDDAVFADWTTKEGDLAHEELEEVIRDIDDYVSVTPYLDGEGVIVEGVNDSVLDDVRRYARSTSWEAVKDDVASWFD